MSGLPGLAGTFPIPLTDAIDWWIIIKPMPTDVLPRATRRYLY
jgi:hypothetical protein